jgi:RecA/RadA recombinase
VVRITTGSQALDELLGGGFSTRTFIFIFIVLSFSTYRTR